MGHLRRFGDVPTISALPLRTDIVTACRHAEGSLISKLVIVDTMISIATSDDVGRAPLSVSRPADDICLWGMHPRLSEPGVSDACEHSAPEWGPGFHS
jgi:hypothetical protein